MCTMQVKMIEFYSELIRQRDNPTDDAFKVTLKGLTALEVQKVADFIKEDLMKNRNQIAYKYGRVYE